jgi:hypothetical protein
MVHPGAIYLHEGDGVVRAVSSSLDICFFIVLKISSALSIKPFILFGNLVL